MALIRDIAAVCKSKNAGPFDLTIDVVFDSDEMYDRVRATGVLCPGLFARLYNVDETDILFTPYPAGRAFKATLPRLKILTLFEQGNVRHLSAEDVYKILINEGLDIGLATVYRVLTQFEQAGLLTRHHFESGKAVFELNQGGHHDHLVCLQCARVETCRLAKRLARFVITF